MARCAQPPTRRALAGRGRFRSETKSIPQRVRELVMLSALAALGCGLAAAQGDLLFVALFGAAV